MKEVVPAPMSGAPPGPSTAFAETNNAFALDLYGRLRTAQGNLICSPFSVQTALGMALAGARGDTEIQMRSTLHFTASGEMAHAENARLIQWLNAEGRRACEIGVANSLWAQDDAPLEDAFVAVLSRYYGEGIHLTDFRGSPDAARATMNRWIEHTSRGRFRELFPAGSLSPDARLALINLVAFKGTWKHRFSRSLTEDQPFYCAGGATETVPLMHQHVTVDYVQAEGYQAVDLAYQGEDISMLLLLPDRGDGLGALEAALSPRALQDCTQRLQQRTVELFIPRCTIRGDTMDLGPQLAALGMATAFDHRLADFSGINGRPPGDSESLYLSNVLQRAFVEVDEKGTVAEAVTAVFTMEFTAQKAPSPVPVFRADHPFFFAIRARESGAILFLGRLNAPS